MLLFPVCSHRLDKLVLVHLSNPPLTAEAQDQPILIMVPPQLPEDSRQVYLIDLPHPTGTKDQVIQLVLLLPYLVEDSDISKAQLSQDTRVPTISPTPFFKTSRTSSIIK